MKAFSCLEIIAICELVIVMTESSFKMQLNIEKEYFDLCCFEVIEVMTHDLKFYSGSGEYLKNGGRMQDRAFVLKEIKYIKKLDYQMLICGVASFGSRLENFESSN